MYYCYDSHGTKFLVKYYNHAKDNHFKTYYAEFVVYFDLHVENEEIIEVIGKILKGC